MLVVAKDTFNLGDKVIILNGAYSGEKGEVRACHYRESEDLWMVTVLLDDETLRNGETLTLSDDRVDLVSAANSRTAGARIALGDVVVGDEVCVEYILDDVVFSRTGIVASIVNNAYMGGIVLNSAKNVSIYRSNWGHAKSVTLLTPNKVHPLEGVGIGTYFTVMADNNDNFDEFRWVKYTDSIWVEELRKSSQITGLIVHHDDEAREAYLKGGKFLEKASS